MKALYLLLNIGAIAIPFAFSFHPKLKFYKHWRSLVIALLITSVIFISWDIIFTYKGIWGFNATYLIGIDLLDLPLEEWLFFLCIPYACIFTHYSIEKQHPNFKLKKGPTIGFGSVLVFVFVLTAISNIDKAYTAINFMISSLILIVVLLKKIVLLQRYLVSYSLIFIPFLLINGVLTGSFINGEVVWYNNEENLGIRLFTIPIEDTVYAFSLILLPLFIMNYIESPSKQQTL